MNNTGLNRQASPLVVLRERFASHAEINENGEKIRLSDLTATLQHIKTPAGSVFDVWTIEDSRKDVCLRPAATSRQDIIDEMATMLVEEKIKAHPGIFSEKNNPAP